MPVQIGAKTHSFSEPTGLLSDCHRRIEMFLGVLVAVGEGIDGLPNEETARALGSALRYFAEAAPKHTADEEVSLFPRLRRIGDPALQSALARLDHLENDHRTVAPLHDTVDRLGKKYLASGKLFPADVTEYRKAVAGLAAIYKEHIRVEDDEVFPLAARALPETEKAAIAGEMAGRRQALLLPDIPKRA